MTGTDRSAAGVGARSVPLATLAAVALFALFRLPALTHYAPWADEALTINLVSGQFVPMLRFLADEQTQPPLSYALLWAWRAIGGDALWWLRLMPCLFGILTAIPTLAICRQAKLTREATALALSLASASQFLVFYSNELRSYALYALTSAWSIALWLRVRNGGTRRDIAWLTAVNIAMVYTHFLGCLVVALEWTDAVASARGRLKHMTISGAITALSLAPWLALVARRAAINASVLDSAAGIVRPTLDAVLDPYLRAIGLSPVLVLDLLVLVAVGVAITVFVARERRDRPEIVTLALLAFVPSVLTIGVSILSPRSIWIHRYMIATTVPFLVVAAAALVAGMPVRFRRFAFALALWPAAVTIGGWVERREKIPFDDLARAISARAAGGDVFVTDWNEGGPMAWQAAHTVTSLHVGHVPVIDSISAPSGWFVWSENHPPRGLPPLAALARHGYRTGDAIMVTGMYDDVLARWETVVAVPFTRNRK